FIHLDPAATEVDSRAILQTVFLAAKHLRDALNDAPADARCSFVTVAHLDGQLGHGGGPFRTIPGGLFGLTKTVNLEWSDVFCRAIDFDASMDAEEAAIRILAECADPNRSIVEVGYSKLGRVTLVPRFEVDTDSSAVAGNGKSTIGKDDVFLVSGGAKGVTAECVAKLATVTGTNFILLGRSEIAEIPAWADGVFGEADLIQAGMKHLKSTGEKPTPMKVKSLIRPVESTRAIEDVLQRVEDAGGQARYISCDVSDAAMMKTKIDGITRDFGAVTGIIHGAGVLADKLIEDTTLEDFRSVYSPKVDGLDAMLRCVEPEQLKHLSLFSSAAGFFGNPAQSDYSIANEILNKAALSFKGEHPECHVTSFNWGPWDGGMVTPELKKLFAERNIDVIPIELGTDLFVHDLSDKANSARQILVGSSMEFDGDSLNGVLNRYSITRNLMVSDNPFLGDHVIDGKPVLPMAGVMNWMASSCEGLHPGYRFFSLDDMKMFKGIVFQNGNLEQIRLEVNEVEKSDGAIKLDVMMWSGNNETRINHYSGTVTLVNGAPATLVYEGFNTDEANAVDGSEFYENGTLFHGPMFQVIDRALNSSEGRLTLECTTRNLSAEDQGQFPVDAQDLYAIDAKFQALLIWARQFKEAGALPTSFSRCEQYRAITPGERFYLSLEIESATNSRVNGTITIHDAHGEVFSRIIGAETTISKSLTFVSATN
ncbi:MAG TPA: SDR family NAD(P)-dependent oxidoreductase, partial [Candidatus Hydrogenedentes bacterium]|nr:SDR family NAD(P)-dependent oxidoreductase [Candidatus Hydrogenedentota bacterium]